MPMILLAFAVACDMCCLKQILLSMTNPKSFSASNSCSTVSLSVSDVVCTKSEPVPPNV